MKRGRRFTSRLDDGNRGRLKDDCKRLVGRLKDREWHIFIMDLEESRIDENLLEYTV